jgi:hypothetical protein
MKLKFNYIIKFFLLVVVLSLSSSVLAADNPSQVTVFILDTTVDYSFVNNLNMAGEISHGSIVGRIIAQEAPQAKLLSYGVEEEGIIKEKLYYQALQRVADYRQEHPDEELLVNISLGFSEAEAKHRKLIDYLIKQGVVVIAAGGNDNSSQPIYPAGFEDTIAVGNATKEAKATSSNYGSWIDICAAGDVSYISRSYLPQGRSVKNFKAVGTSFSAPRVVALLAKLVGTSSDLSAEEGLELILTNATEIADSKYERGLLGAGVISETKTLAQVDSYYYFKNFGPQLVSGILLVSLLLYWIKKYKVVGVFLTILLFLVVLPVVIMLQEIFWANFKLIQVNWQQLNSLEYISLVLSPLIITIITSWQKKFIVSTYLFYLVSSILTLDIINQLGIGFLVYFRVGLMLWTGALILGEQWQLYQVKQQDDIYSLLNLVQSHNRSVFKLAKEKLQTSNWDLEVLLPKLVAEKLDFALIKELVLEQNYNIVEELITLLKRADGELEELIIKLLLTFDSDLVAKEVTAEIFTANRAEQESLLKVIAQTGSQSQQLEEKIKELLFSENEMWLRYQALQTLLAIHPPDEELQTIIRKLSTDSQELVRLEAQKQLPNLLD